MNSGPINGHPPPTLQDHIRQEAASHTEVMRGTDAIRYHPLAASPSPSNSPPDQSILDSVAIDSKRPDAREGSPRRDNTPAQHRELKTRGADLSGNDTSVNLAVEKAFPEIPTSAATVRTLLFINPSGIGSASVEPVSFAMIIFVSI
ncbi:hypothetical protein B9Z19DRAFT_1131891 [Tuber borchii]|uniref:Uncharacterized protein n=1 Tax=Tuber borchii TaxID=42251 RepID=A0A2T6ZI21_TUBBO|nr:hypothetical protein B9Z19DRAFT_1131891 [Tuber borchii]